MFTKENFRDKILRRGSIIVPYFGKKRENGSRLYKSIKALKRMSEFLPFECNFKNGRCKTFRKQYNHDAMCCCRECFDRVGYIDQIAEKDLWYYAQRFKKGIGFWRKDKGCILDREMRSATCLSYSCHEYGSSEEEMFDAYLTSINQKESEFRKDKMNELEWKKSRKNG